MQAAPAVAAPAPVFVPVPYAVPAPVVTPYPIWVAPQWVDGLKFTCNNVAGCAPPFLCECRTVTLTGEAQAANYGDWFAPHGVTS